ncbi:MAG: ABC transporter ATP-binding protein [Bacillota bacterium]|jgi:oligopeptide transport system ATP-binding protein
MTEPLLVVGDLRLSFMTHAGEVQAVRGVSFSVDAGETLAIVGESGCGKSVSAQAIMKLNPEPPAEVKGGSIRYRGEELIHRTDKEMERYRGREFAMIFQDSMTALNPTSRVGAQIVEAIRLHRRLGKREAQELAIDLLREVGLPDPEQVYRRYPHTLSGGMRQRVMIAMALSCDPSILIADEPTTALDVTMQAQILRLMQRIQRERNKGIILITHDLGVVASIADRVSVMYAGKIVESGTLRQIFYEPRHPYTWGLIGSMPSLSMRRGQKLISIPGTPPDLFAPPPGCGFAARCPYCMRVCVRHDPPPLAVDETHQVSCWLEDPRVHVKPTPPVGRMRQRQAAGRGD